ncbi:MAG: hypothetical protein KDE56_21710 [Anaerolineales bacterium]|nr:hypothetical protein [Anaerolineales bacterium]
MNEPKGTIQVELTFKAWLLKQTERKDAIGKLAQAMSKMEYTYTPRRKNDEHKKWADIITRHGEVRHVVAFNQAWREYQIAKEAAIAAAPA